MPWPASSCAACERFCCSVAAMHVAGVDFLPSGALHVQHRRLEDAPERERLLGLLLLAARELLDRVLEVLVEIAPELRHVGAAGGEDPLAVGIVRQRVQQVLERQVRVTPRGRLAIGDGQDDFESWTEHFSICRGAPPPRPVVASLSLATVITQRLACFQ